MADIDNFREEFNDLINKYQASESEQCEDEHEEDFPDYIIELKTKMLSPAKCGLYFSKKDIRQIAAEAGENISLKQRDRMLNDLLKSVFDLEEMERMFDIMKGFIDKRITYYDEFSETFDQSAPLFADHRKKALALRKSLDRILDESGGKTVL